MIITPAFQVLTSAEGAQSSLVPSILALVLRPPGGRRPDGGGGRSDIKIEILESFMGIALHIQELGTHGVGNVTRTASGASSSNAGP